MNEPIEPFVTNTGKKPLFGDASGAIVWLEAVMEACTAPPTRRWRFLQWVKGWWVELRWRVGVLVHGHDCWP